ncbi:MAG: DUF1552 domain-containing protein [Lentisphaeraceae bacterium]|nr:DUF1552 domain-containing protein [Lentisphaeraceae bacterium]
MNINRRNFLHAAGVSLALPWMETFASPNDATKKRLLLIGVPLGLNPESFIPTGTGKDYKPSKYLSLLDEFKNDYTAISGIHHPGVVGGHSAEPRLFTGIASNLKNRRSLDQYIASHIGQKTRYDSLVLSSGKNEFSWTDGGTKVPPIVQMSEVYEKLFIQEKSSSKSATLAKIGKGKSILDFVMSEAKTMKPKISKSDQNKLNEYFESVRESEKQLTKSEAWIHKPKPKVNVKNNFEQDGRSPLLGDHLKEVLQMSNLAFQSDSTRIITMGYFRQNLVEMKGVNTGYHNLSHHGLNPISLEQLRTIEKQFFKELHSLLKTLKNTQEGNSTMLDNTTIVVSSNLGNGNNHSTKNLPVLLLGGKYKHQQHLDLAESKEPLSNLFVSILHQFGINDKSFGSSTGTLKGLDLV